MKLLLKRFLISICFLISGNFTSWGATAEDTAVEVSVLAPTNSPQITLQWPAPSITSAPTGYTIYRKSTTATNWTQIGTLSAGSLSYTDSSVSIGVLYEYQATRAGAIPATGYVYTGIDVPLVEQRGKVILIVDNTHTSNLSTELARLQEDLIGDGWVVIRKNVAPTDSVASVKSLIKNEYTQDPSNVKAVFLLGHVPVPYSGQINPDGHPDHLGAWPTDLYYGDMDGSWTDSSINYTATSARQTNIPGDGKFDQSSPPSQVELQIGRVDLSNMGNFLPKTEGDLLRQYLNKDHNFRHKIMTAQPRGLIDDNFGYFNGEAFAASGWRNFSAFFGANNINALDWFTTLATQSYLWAYGCGGGNYSGASGIGSTSQFVSTDIQAIFTMLFGSYFGDWDTANNFLRAPLASTTYGLTCSWAGRPHWYYQSMALGETIGYATRATQNNQGTYSPGYSGSHVALMGDPTLRLHIVSPVLNVDLSRTTTSGPVQISWEASPDTILGYHVYRSLTPEGPYTRITNSLITTLTISDANAPTGDLTYMVRAIKREVSGSGSYFNPSTGIKKTISGSAPANSAPVVNAGNDQTILISTAALLSGSATDDALPATPGFMTYAWTKTSGPGTVAFGNNTLLQTTAVFSATGTTILRLTAFDGDKSSFDEVSINVLKPNTPPTALSQTISVSENINTPLVLIGSDPDVNQVLTFTVVSLPTHGSLSGTAPQLIYSPTPNYTGSDTFSFKVNDGLQDSPPATVTISVIANAVVTNSAPSVNLGSNQTIQWPASLDLTAAVSDDGLPTMPGNLALTWLMVSGGGTVVFSNPNEAHSMVSFSSPGQYLLRLTASDGLLTTSRDITITITQPPLLEQPDQGNGFVPFKNVFNPIQGQTLDIEFELAENKTIRLAIYSMMGEEVIELANNSKSVGTHIIRWDGRSQSQSVVASGTYMVLLDVAGDVHKKKIVVVK